MFKFNSKNYMGINSRDNYQNAPLSSWVVLPIPQIRQIVGSRVLKKLPDMHFWSVASGLIGLIRNSDGVSGVKYGIWDDVSCLMR